MNTNDPLRNLKDPLRKSGPDNALQLFRVMSQTATGFGHDDVISAAVNILVNAMRQTYPTRVQAEARFNELSGRTKTILLGHYDSVTGKRRNVFPFDQVVTPAFLGDRDKVPKTN